MTTLTAPPLAFGRTTATEARKLVNTRTSVILLGVAALLAGAFSGGRALFPAPDTTLTSLVAMAFMPASWITMVMAILLVASEFSTRGAAITFALDPRRGRVLAGKASVVVGLALVASALSVLAGQLVAVVAPLLTGRPVPLTMDAPHLGVAAGSLLFMALAGFAWALLLRNAPAPIVVLLIWPTIALLIGSASDAVRAALAWISLEPFFALLDGGTLAWAQLATSALVWIVAPAALGAWRLVRDDL